MKTTAADSLFTLLIVDDTPANLSVVVESLESRGYRIVVAQDSEEALQRAAFIKPDLILLDVMMPGMDGFEVCRRLKNQADTDDIPVIFMTALTDIDHKITGFKVGGVDYVTKPIQIDELAARVGAHLSLKAMQRQLQAQNDELQAYQTELELRVRQRTAELSDSNRQLRKSEAEFRTLAENSPDMIVRYDRDCRRIYVNPAYQRETGMETLEPSAYANPTRGDALLQPDGCRYPENRDIRVSCNFWLPESGQPAQRSSCRDEGLIQPSNGWPCGEYLAWLRRVMATGEPGRMLLEWHMPDGSWIFHDMKAVAEYDEAGQVTGILVMGHNITELKTTERRLQESRAQLHALATQREQTREDERKRIAREIHDELGQLLNVLRLNIATLDFRFGGVHAELRAQAQQMVATVDSAILMAQNLVSRLRPAVMDAGLVSALQWLVRDYADSTSIDCRLQVAIDDDVCLDGDKAMAVFRIVQESLTNVLRHSGADRVDISLRRDGDHCELNVLDNGKGFNPDNVARRHCYGIAGMRERALLLQGTLDIVAVEAGGTLLTLRMPVNKVSQSR